MIKFTTEYRIPIPGKTKASRFSSYVWADNHAAARTLCRLRGLDERIVGFSVENPENASVPHPGHKHFTHWLCFFGFFALKAGKTPEELFGDAGILHDLNHAPYTLRDSPTKDYIALCQELGFLPVITEKPNLIQMQHPRTKMWVKIDTQEWRIVSRRRTPFKNVEKA